MKEQQRKSEEEDAEAAIAKHEEDPSPSAGEENWREAAPSLITVLGGSQAVPRQT